MDQLVGLVSATRFRVPNPGLLEVFGQRALCLPTRDAPPPAAHPCAVTEDPTGSDSQSALGPAVTADKARRAKTLVAEHDALTGLHRVEVEPAERPTVPDCSSTSPTARPVLRSLDAQRRRRTAAMSATTPEHAGTEGSGPTTAAAPTVDLLDPAGAHDRALVQWWDALCGNDPSTVLAHLARTFAATGTPATPLALVGGLLDVAVLAPGAHLLPRDTVSLVGGTVSIRLTTAAHRAWLDRQVVAGLSLAAARRTLAAAPGVITVRVHALRASHRGHHADLTVVGSARLHRDTLDAAPLGPDAETVLRMAADDLRWQPGGLHGALQPQPLDELTGLAPLFARVCRTRGRILA